MDENTQALIEHAQGGVILSPQQYDIYIQLLTTGHNPEEAREWVIDYVSPEFGEEPKFAVTDLESANWVLRKIAENQATLREYEAMRQAEVDAIDARYRRITAHYHKSIEFFGAVYGPQIEEFAKGKLEGQKSRSLKLIHGAIGFRRSPDTLVVDDEDKAIEALEWLQAQDPLYGPELIKTKKSVAKTELKKLLIAWGDTDLKEITTHEVVAHIIPGADNFYYKAEMPEAE